MSVLLDQFLKKIGVKNYLDLTEEEKETFRNWEISLSGRRLTDEDVKAFLNTELDAAVGKLTDMQLSEREDTFLKMKVDFIRKVKIFLDGPERERQMIEKQIKSQL